LPEAFSQVFLHIVWATWDRRPMLSMGIRDKVYQVIQAECRNMGVQVIALNGIADHIHLFVRIPVTITIATILKQVKGSSSHFATHEIPGAEAFRWQGSYGVLSVSPDDVPFITKYIENQAQHHHDGSILDEWERAEIRASDL
jgi:REP element-mobilizing transposase RayT